MNPSKVRNQRFSIQIATLIFAMSAAIVAWSVVNYEGTREDRQLQTQLLKISEKINLLLANQEICSRALTRAQQSVSVDKMSDVALYLGPEGLGELKAGTNLAEENVAITSLGIENLALLGASEDGNVQYFTSRLFLSIRSLSQMPGASAKTMGRDITEFITKRDKTTGLIQGCASQKNESLCVSRGRIFIPENVVPALPNAPKDPEGCASFNAISIVPQRIEL